MPGLFSNNAFRINLAKHLIVWIGCFVFCVHDGVSQNPYFTSGTEFLTTRLEGKRTFGYNNTNPNDSTGDFFKFDRRLTTNLIFGGLNEACIRVQEPRMNFDTTFYLGKGTIAVFPLSLLTPANTVEQNYDGGVFVQSTAPIFFAQFLDFIGPRHFEPFPRLISQMEATSISSFYHTERTNFFAPNTIVSFRVSWTYFAFLTILSLESQNEFQGDIRVSRVGSYSSSSIINPGPISFVINKGDARHFLLGQSDSSVQSSFSNFSYLESKNNLSFKIFIESHLNGGCKRLNISSTDGRAGFTTGPNFEELKPTEFYGQSFHVAPLDSNAGPYYSLFAIHPQTEIRINGNLVAVLDAGERMDTCMGGAVHITATHPIFGHQTTCTDIGTEYHGFSPFTTTIQSDQELIKDGMFYAIDLEDSLNTYIVGVVTPTSGIGQLSLDSQLVSPTMFQPFPTAPDWSYANLYVQPGPHRISSPVGFHAIHYTRHLDTGPGNDSNFANPFPAYGYVVSEAIEWPADSFYLRVGYDPQNLLPFDSLAPSVCVGEPVYFQPGHMRHLVWTYDFDDGNQAIQVVGNHLAPQISHSWQVPGRYLVTLTDTTGCYPPESIWVEVKPGAQTDYEATVSRSCAGNQVFLSYFGEDATQVRWLHPDGMVAGQRATFNYTGNDTAVTISMITDLEGCLDTVTFSVSITDPDFAPELLPNVVTPNGDGVNDVLCIPNARGYAACFRLEVFNRWGIRVFETDDPDQCWSPGNLPAGVYFYVIEIGSQSYKRSVTVVR
jgi:gliding motility-associated-like protein